jgi:2-keto-3-deoxy-L-rhamnonate aldolase RhmA
MRTNAVKAKLARGEIALGAWVNSSDPQIAWIMAAVGFDWLIVDMEHGPVSLEAAANAVATIRTTPTEPFVRACWNASTAIQRPLDCGASGIMIPMINDAAAAHASVKDTRYWPLGQRSRGGMRTGLSFGTDALTYFDRANDEVFVLAQIETKAAIENIDEIAAVEGIDCLFVGPNDLASTYGETYPAAWANKSDAYKAAIELVPRVAKAHGKAPGILANSAAMANECIALGYTVVGVSADTSYLAAAARREFAAVKLPG